MLERKCEEVMSLNLIVTIFSFSVSVTQRTNSSGSFVCLKYSTRLLAGLVCIGYILQKANESCLILLLTPLCVCGCVF